MKKVFSILILLILASCGGNVTQSSSLGQTRSFAPISVDPTNLERITNLCNALTYKTQRLTNATATAAFNVRKSVCGGPLTSSRETVEVKGSTPNFYFVRTDQGHEGEGFLFHFIETPEAGAISPLCTNLANLTNPIISGSTAIWFSTISTRDCVPGPKEVCIFLERGVQTAKANEYRITSQEWMKFQLDTSSAMYGFYIDRKYLSSEECQDNKISELQAQLTD